MDIEFKKHAAAKPRINGPIILAKVFANDDFEVEVWTNVHGHVEVRINHPGAGESASLTAMDTKIRN